MKKLILCTILMAAAWLPASGATLYMTASPVTGNAFDLTLQVSDPFQDHQNDRILWFGLDFSSLLSSLDAVSIGSQFFDLAPFSPAQIAGQANAIDGIGAADVTGRLTLATLHVLFTGPDVPSALVSITSNPDPIWGGLQFDDGSVTNLSGEITVSRGAGNVPEPATFAFGGLGLATLGILSRRRLRA